MFDLTFFTMFVVLVQKVTDITSSENTCNVKKWVYTGEKYVSIVIYGKEMANPESVLNMFSHYWK